MENTNAADTLLALLFEETGLNYLSDLHFPNHYAAIREALEKIPADQFDANTWRAVASYVLGCIQPLRNTPKEAKSCMRDALAAPPTP